MGAVPCARFRCRKAANRRYARTKRSLQQHSQQQQQQQQQHQQPPPPRLPPPEPARRQAVPPPRHSTRAAGARPGCITSRRSWTTTPARSRRPCTWTASGHETQARRPQPPAPPSCPRRPRRIALHARARPPKPTRVGSLARGRTHARTYGRIAPDRRPPWLHARRPCCGRGARGRCPCGGRAEAVRWPRGFSKQPSTSCAQRHSYHGHHLSPPQMMGIIFLALPPFPFLAAHLSIP